MTPAHTKLNSGAYPLCEMYERFAGCLTCRATVKLLVGQARGKVQCQMTKRKLEFLL